MNNDKRLVLVSNPSKDYPPIVDSIFIRKFIQKIHSNECDFEEGNLLERIEEYSGKKFVLCEVDLKDIDYGYYYVDEDMVDEYLDEPLDTMPPIILDTPISYQGEPLEKFPLIDGTHRCHVLKKMGLSNIRAYVPML